MELLRAVNRILGEIGEHPVTSIEAKNPTVSVILQAISDESRTVQGRGWWFNNFETELFPDPDGHVYLRGDVLDWDCIQHPSIVRGEKLLCSRTMSDNWTDLGVSKIKGRVTLFIEFEDLPPSFQEWVVCLAGIRAFTNDLGMEEVVNLFMQREMQAANKVMSDHMRHRSYSTARTPMFQRMTRHLWR